MFCFIIPLGAGVALRFLTVKSAAAEIRYIAEVGLAARNEGGPPDKNRSGKDLDFNQLVDTVIHQLYGSPTASERARYDSIVRAVLFDIFLRRDASETPKDPQGNPPVLRPDLKAFESRTHTVLRNQSLNLILIQCVLVIYFPALFLLVLLEAKGEVQEGSGIAATGPKFETYSKKTSYLRCRLLLQREGRPLFMLRMGFAMLLGLFSTYLFAPTGIQSTMLAEFASLRPTPGENAFPAWFGEYRYAPAVMAGLVGFFLYAMGLFIERYMVGDLGYLLLVSLFKRAMTVLAISLILSSVTVIDGGEGLSRSVAFLVGIFPDEGLRLIAAVARGRFVDRVAEVTQAITFKEVPELDLLKASSLAEIGLSNVHDLAKADIKEVILRVGINPNILIHAVDRALLLDVFGVEVATTLGKKIAIATASDLVLYAFGLRLEMLTLPIDVDSVRIYLSNSNYQNDRKKDLEQLLELADLSVPVERLRGDTNLCYIISTRRGYKDIN